jgi:hypothetical protein
MDPRLRGDDSEKWSNPDYEVVSQGDGWPLLDAPIPPVKFLFQPFQIGLPLAKQIFQ